MLCYVHGKKFIVKPDHDWAVKKLNELRNQFVHFAPKGWSLDLLGLPGRIPFVNKETTSPSNSFPGGGF